MPDNRLVNYIKANLANGANEEQIRKALAEVGWADDLVNEAFLSLQKPKEDFVVLPKDEPIPESGSAKFMWILLIILVVGLIVAVVSFVILNGNGKQNGEAKTIISEELVGNKEAIVNEENTEMPESEPVEEIVEITTTPDWLDGEAWEKQVDELFDLDNDAMELPISEKFQRAYPGEEGKFYLIEKTYGENQLLIYLAYRGQVGKCFFTKEDWQFALSSFPENWALRLDDLKEYPFCEGNFFEEPAFSALKNLKIEGLSTPIVLELSTGSTFLE